jgi:pyrimidine oxygenase
MRKVELGLFMPVASNGFLFSKRTPRYHPTYDLHQRIADYAEEIGLDYLFWMGKWKGFGGETGFWEQSLEPITLSGAIAARTSKLKLFVTINPLLFHPAIAAKMIATLDDISGGRIGINVVTGNTLDEYEQMGLVPEGYNENRYAYAEEWTEVLKSLWSQEKTTHKGRFFNLVDCVSAPKPRQKPYPLIVSAGTSDEGLRYGARHSDYQFIGVRPEEIAKVRAFAAEENRSIKISTNIFLLPGNTDAEADAEFAAIREQLDHDALENLIASFDRDHRDSYGKRTSWLRAPHVVGFGSGTPIVGSPPTIARKLAALITESGVDALQFTFVDYLRDLQIFHHNIAPVLKELLERDGITVGLPSLKASAA